MRFRFMSVKWNAATRYSAHPFTTKTDARVGTKHVFTLLVLEMVRGIQTQYNIVWATLGVTHHLRQ